MTDKEPTREQRELLWKWCGLKEGTCGWLYDPSNPTMPIFPPVDLNNLFKYAVPKLDFCQLHKNPLVVGYQATISVGDEPAIIRRNPDPALALFWAIYEGNK